MRALLCGVSDQSEDHMDHAYIPIEMLSERAGDTGVAGRTFEADFMRGCDLLGLQYEAQTGKSGAIWDIKLIGLGWHRLVRDRPTNIKVSGTRWLFGAAEVYKAMKASAANVRNGTWDESDAEERVKRAVKDVFRRKGLPGTAFMKPKSPAIQKAIQAAVKKKDLKSLGDLLVAKNFLTKRLGNGYKIEVDVNWKGFDCEERPGCATSAAKRTGSWQKTAKIKISGGVYGRPFNIVTEIKWQTDKRAKGGPSTKGQISFRDRNPKSADKPHWARQAGSIPTTTPLGEALDRKADDYRALNVVKAVEDAIWDTPSDVVDYEPISKPSAKLKRMVANCNKLLSRLDDLGREVSKTNDQAKTDEWDMP
jgi:hypothetical protein